MPSRDETIPISDLLLDELNPRLDDTVGRQGQTQVIASMVNDETIIDSVFKLAVDIIQYGLDPTTRLAVLPSEEAAGKYVVLEGNRRLLALKILSHPDLIKDQVRKPLEKAFKDLSAKFMASPIESVFCVVFENEFEADHWIKMRHTGQNEGAGLVEWNSLAQARYAARKGDVAPEVQILDFVRDYGTLDDRSKANLAKFKITNLQRIIITKDVRESLGLTMKKRMLYTKHSLEQIIVPLQKIVEDLMQGKKVNELMSKEQRLEYIKSLGPEILPSPAPESAPEVLLADLRPSPVVSSPVGGYHGAASLGSPTGHSGSGSHTQTPSVVFSAGAVVTAPGPSSTTGSSGAAISAGSPTGSSAVTGGTGSTNLTVREIAGIRDRSTIIPSKYVRKIPDTRINEIFKELKKLNVRNLPNAGSVLMRVFLELSVDHFMKDKNIVISNPKDETLAKKIRLVIEFLEKNGSNPRDLVAVKKFTTEQNSIGSTLTLNAYVHNPTIFPDGEILKITWHNLLPLIERIWP